MIVLVGFMGAGKTTVGRVLAERLGLPFVDSDVAIEQRAGRSVRDIFSRSGEARFRALEHETILEILAGPDAVLALGGGAVGHPGTRSALGGTHVIYLEVALDEALGRVAGDSGRPMLAAPDLRGLYERRLSLYREVATLRIPTDARRPEAVALDVVSRVTWLAELNRAAGAPSPGRPR